MLKSAIFLKVGICVLLALVADRGRVVSDVLDELETDEMQKIFVSSYFKAKQMIQEQVSWLTCDDCTPGGNCKFTLYRCKPPRKQITNKKAGPLVLNLCCKQDRSS